VEEKRQAWWAAERVAQSIERAIEASLERKREGAVLDGEEVREGNLALRDQLDEVRAIATLCRSSRKVTFFLLPLRHSDTTSYSALISALSLTTLPFPSSSLPSLPAPSPPHPNSLRPSFPNWRFLLTTPLAVDSGNTLNGSTSCAAGETNPSLSPLRRTKPLSRSVSPNNLSACAVMDDRLIDAAVATGRQ
jgi:hypothetical protein